MNPIKTTVIEIHPATNVRSTQGDRWLFKVSDEYLEEYDKKKVLREVEVPKRLTPNEQWKILAGESIERKTITKIVEGKPGRNLSRKRQLEKYNAFKEEVRWLAKKMEFEMPRGYFALWFYVPHPKSWRKKKINEMLYKPHETTPDWDNYIKALFDALMPRKSKTKGEKGTDDRRIHCGAPFKVWVKPEEACIKILEYDKDEFMEVFMHGHPSFGR